MVVLEGLVDDLREAESAGEQSEQDGRQQVEVQVGDGGGEGGHESQDQEHGGVAESRQDGGDGEDDPHSDHDDESHGVVLHVGLANLSDGVEDDHKQGDGESDRERDDAVASVQALPLGLRVLVDGPGEKGDLSDDESDEEHQAFHRVVLQGVVQDLGADEGTDGESRDDQDDESDVLDEVLPELREVPDEALVDAEDYRQGGTAESGEHGADPDDDEGNEVLNSGVSGFHRVRIPLHH